MTQNDPTRAIRQQIERNPGTALNLDWVREIHVDRSAVERRTQSLPGRRTVKKQWQAAWLLRAIACMDLTTLAGDDTPGRVARLCAKAIQPVRSEIVTALGVESIGLKVGAVCVYHEMIEPAVRALEGSGVPVAAVSTGFPAGLSSFKTRVEEIRQSVEAGAGEIDIVISRRYVLTGEWKKLYDEMRTFRETCGGAHVKAILATGELGQLRNVAKASMVCMMGGADFIKTSTGKESVNATLPFGLVMCRMIREYHEQTNFKVGLKPAGGIRYAKQALDWLILMKEELGNDWLTPHLFRLGASSLLTDIERQLEHYLTGHYAATHHQPLA